MDDFIPTRAAKNKKNAEKLHVVTTYEAHKKVSNPSNEHRKKEISALNKRLQQQHDSDEDMDDNHDEPIDEKRKQEIDMKRYRYDVIKFGMSGFEKQKARQAKIALAISLGAKPPKNKRRNYKKIIQEKKIEKAREVKKEKFKSGFNPSQLVKNKRVDKSKLHHKKDKDSNGILGVYGKVTKDKGHKRKGGKAQKRKSGF